MDNIKHERDIKTTPLISPFIHIVQIIDYLM